MIISKQIFNSLRSNLLEHTPSFFNEYLWNCLVRKSDLPIELPDGQTLRKRRNSLEFTTNDGNSDVLDRQLEREISYFILLLSAKILLPESVFIDVLHKFKESVLLVDEENSYLSKISSDQVNVKLNHTFFTRDQLREILYSHPSLGAPKESLSRNSFLEQGHTRNKQVNQSCPNLMNRLEKLNKSYRDLTGLPFVIWVNGRSLETISQVLEDKIMELESQFEKFHNTENIIDEELLRGLESILSIGFDRFSKSLSKQ